MSSRGDLKIVFHIGGAKCGSSAIQASMAQNVALLAERGIGVPGQALDFKSPVTGEQIWYLEDAAASGRHDAIGEQMRALCGEARRRGFHTLVVSAENMCNHPDLATTMAGAIEAVEGACAEVVLYVRRQDDFLISSWQQWNLKRFDRLSDFLTRAVGRDACWFAMIEPWADAFGDARIKVRPFVRDRLKSGDVVADFYGVAGISDTGLRPLLENANPSFNEALARLAHRVRDVFDGPHDNRFYDVMVDLIGKSALKSGSASSLFSLDTRLLIMACYAEQNAALRDRFLPEMGDAPLFPLPDADNVRDMTDSEKLREEIAMLTRAVYALAERTEKCGV